MLWRLLNGLQRFLRSGKRAAAGSALIFRTEPAAGIARILRRNRRAATAARVPSLTERGHTKRRSSRLSKDSGPPAGRAERRWNPTAARRAVVLYAVARIAER